MTVLGNVRARFEVFVSDIVSQTGSVILFNTPGYPMNMPGFQLTYNKEQFEMYHFEAHSGMDKSI